jgi:tetratricopeptide (TPR) repeat protein
MKQTFLLAALLAFTAPALAQPASENMDAIARAHFQAGTGYFETGDYANAIREFERAYELTHYPQLLYNLYASHERLGQLEPAAARLAQFIEASPDAPNRVALEERLANLRRRIEQGSTAPSETPENTTLTEPAPEGESESEAEPPPLPVREEAQRPRSAAPFIMFSAAGVGLVTFTVAGFLARAEDRDLARTCGRDAGRTCTDSQVSRLKRRTAIADTGLGVTIGFAALGAVLLLAQPGEAAVTMSAGVDQNGGSVGITGRF